MQPSQSLLLETNIVVALLRGNALGAAIDAKDDLVAAVRKKIGKRVNEILPLEQKRRLDWEAYEQFIAHTGPSVEQAAARMLRERFDDKWSWKLDIIPPPSTPPSPTS